MLVDCVKELPEGVGVGGGPVVCVGCRIEQEGSGEGVLSWSR